jgi:hypothetical protein
MQGEHHGSRIPITRAFRTHPQREVIMNRSTTNGRLLTLLGVLATAGAAAPATAQYIADSRLDFSDVQGANGWTYGFFDGNDPGTAWGPEDFAPLTYFDGVWRRGIPGPGSYWTAIERNGGHPNSTVTSAGRIPEENWAVRRWTSDGTYLANIHGRLWDNDPTPGHGDGVIGSIMINGRVIWSETIDNGNHDGVPYSVVACLEPGTIVDFIIAPRENDFCDDTGFIAEIHTVIETQPLDVMVCPNGTANFTVVTIADVTYQWRFNGDPIPDANDATLTIPNVSAGDVGVYDCVVSIPDCGSMVSDPAELTICYADFNCDGFVNSQDFFDFVHLFLDNDIAADFNANGKVDSPDYFDFLTVFFAGC